jgi:hypothetical protein
MRKTSFLVQIIHGEDGAPVDFNVCAVPDDADACLILSAVASSATIFAIQRGLPPDYFLKLVEKNAGGIKRHPELTRGLRQ